MQTVTSIDPTLERILYVVLGWLLGIVGPLVAEAVKLRRTLKGVKRALTEELHLLRYRLAHVAFALARHLGEWDRQFLQSLLPALKAPQGVALETRLEEAIKGLLGYTDEQLGAVAQKSRAEPGISTSMRRFETPYLNASVAQLPHLPYHVHHRLAEIRTQLSIYNDLVEEARSLHAMTFQDLSEQNRRAVDNNLLTVYRNALERCRIILEVASKIDPDLPG